MNSSASGRSQAITHRFTSLELAIMQDWSEILKFNKALYASSSEYYVNLDRILSIIGGISKGIAGASVLTALLTDKFGIPQWIVTTLTIIFLISSTVISAIVDKMEYKPKSILYEETSRACEFLIKEIDMQCAVDHQTMEFSVFGKLVKHWMEMIVIRAGKVPPKMLNQHVVTYQHHNIILEAMKLRDPIVTVKIN